MGNFIKTQSSFANGAVAPEFYSNDNINGLAHLQNMDVLSGGGLRRRPGLVSVCSLLEDACLIPFSVSDDENYLLALGDNHLLIYNTDGSLVHDCLIPWRPGARHTVQYAQRFGTIIFVHPDYKPYILHKDADGIFSLDIFDFARNDADMSVNMPFMRFEDSVGVTITVSTHTSGNNYATLTTNIPFWVSSNVGTRLDMLGKQWLITSVIDSSRAVAYVNGGYSLPTSAVADWRENAFSARRGWPASITFHQDRLVYGGSRSYPGGIWLSQVGRHTNFNVGTGLDDEAIFITLVSGRRQQISTVVSSDNLQILTTVGEWSISSKPLTPSSVDIKQHTSVGSMSSRYMAPQKIEGQTVFVAANGRDIRELSLDELGEHYNATDLCTYAKHLMNNPVDIAYNDNTHQLFVVKSDGDMAVLNYNSRLGISAWAVYKTSGQFKSVAVIDGITWVVVYRNGRYCLERFDINALADANNMPFTCIATALPLRISGHNADKLRVRKITARVLDTKTLFINDMRVNLPNEIYHTSSPGFSGDVSATVLGTKCDYTVSPWRITSSDMLPITILSVTIHGFYNI